MGKQEVIDVFKCFVYLTSVIYKKIATLLDLILNIFNLENIVLPKQL